MRFGGGGKKGNAGRIYRELKTFYSRVPWKIDLRQPFNRNATQFARQFRDINICPAKFALL